MANMHDILLRYNKSISLTPTEVRYLRNARKSITKKVKNYFEETQLRAKPKFIGQGSFSMGTIIKPLKGSYDIDIGVYLQGYSNWQSDWPAPETASKWLFNALENHTSIKPINKKTCLRIIYKPISNKDINYHVDLPVYIQYSDLFGYKYTRIGLIGNQKWSQKSGPIEFTNWFKTKCQANKTDKNQLVRIVKYFKAWKNKIANDGIKTPNGMILTVLAASKYYPHERDDISLYNTLKKVYNKLDWSFYIEKPVQPFNNLGEYLNSKQWETFQESLLLFVKDADIATKTDDYEKAKEIWAKYFDDRFLN